MMKAIELRDIPEDYIFRLVEKMDVRGPRYTSYPTVPVWSGNFPPEPLRQAIERISRSGKPIAVYLHLPFCRTRCWYCGCNSCISHDINKFRNYVDAVKAEIDLLVGNLSAGLTHSQLHLGGGTPTHLPWDMLAELLDYLILNIPGGDRVDRSVEVDPRVTTKEHLAVLVERGFRRISIGLQDLNPDVQKAVNRRFSVESMMKFVSMARDSGFTGVNIDLIYGLPKQTRSTWLNTMEEVLKFDPDRLACFGYAHLPSKMKHQNAIKESELPSPRERLGMLLDADGFFADNNYEAIGMDHFAKPDDELSLASHESRLWRNFMGYTANKGLELLGLGTSSISEFNDLFVQNLYPPEPYQAEIAAARLAVSRGHRLDRDDVIRKRFINHLMCNLEIKIPEPKDQADLPTIDRLRAQMADLKSFEDEGLIVSVDTGYRVTPLGQLFLRNLAMPFDRYLSPESAASFSRTV